MAFSFLQNIQDTITQEMCAYADQQRYFTVSWSGDIPPLWRGFVDTVPIQTR